MGSNNSRHIICAVRGGPECRSTVTQAIDLALERNARLTFLHVIDAEFLEYATVGPLSVVYEELHEMGAFMMLILADRAQRRGVQEVDYILKEGNIRAELRDFALSTHASTMVMGRPIRSPGRNVFKTAEYDTFVEQLSSDSGINIISVRHES